MLVCSESQLWRVQAAGGSRVRAALARLRAASLAAFLRLYPVLHMAAEGATFGYQMAYLLQASPFFSPSLHLLGQHVVRTSGQEMVRPCRPLASDQCSVALASPANPPRTPADRASHPQEGSAEPRSPAGCHARAILNSGCRSGYSRCNKAQQQ